MLCLAALLSSLHTNHTFLSHLVHAALCSEAKAQAACDVRNSRYDRRLQAAVEELADTASAGGLPSSSSFPDRCVERLSTRG